VLQQCRLVETGNRTTGLLVSAGADTNTHQYWQVSADTRYQYRSNHNAHAHGCQKRQPWTPVSF